MFKRTVQMVAIALLSFLVVGVIRSGFLLPASAGDVSTSAIDRYSHYYLNSNNDEPTNGSVKATFYGTTMFLLDDGETKLLFDAFITRPSADIINRSIVGEPLIQTDQAVLDTWLARPEVGKPAAVFAAHSHHDHAMDIAYVAQKTGAQVYGSESTLNIARGGDVSEEQLVRYQLGKELAIGDFTVTVLPGRHALNPDPLPDDRGVLILEPLRQPAKFLDYTEGGAFDFLIQHGDHRILLKGHTYIPEVLDSVQADVLFLSVSPLAAGDLQSPDVFYDQTVGTANPKLVIPTHWDQFFLPLSDHLVPLSDEDLTTSFDFLIRRLATDSSQFGIMQGYQSIMLFSDDGYGA